MRKKRYGLLLIMGICFLVLSGCGKQQEETKTNEIDVKWDNVKDGDKIEAEIDNFVTIDADVSIPEKLKNMTMEKIKAHRPCLQEDEVKTIFFDKREKPERTLDENYKCREFGDYDIVYLRGPDDLMSLTASDVSYTRKDMDYIRNCVFDDPEFDSYNLERYSSTEDLDFMKKEEVFQKVKEAYSKMGVVISDEYECYALDHGMLKQEENPVDVKGNVLEEEKKGTWTKVDDAYYFILHQEVDGIPISQIAYGDGYEGTGIETTELKAVYGAKGWMELQQYWGYVLERTGENWEILSIKDAVNSLQKKCSMLVTDGKWKIEKIELELIPVFIKDNDYEIRPVWTFIGGELITDDFEYPLCLRFDAITGKEIIS